MQEPQHDVTLRFLAAPSDVNFFGNAHGGMVMRWIDEAAYTCAVGWCGRDSVTVYVGGIRFYKPVHIGDLVEVRARLIYTGQTSMHIAVDVRAGDPRQSERKHTTHCVIVYVALDADGNPSPVAGWIPHTQEEFALQEYAVKLMDLRKGIEEEMRPYIDRD